LNIAANSTSIVELPNSGSLTNTWIDLTLPAGVAGYSVLRQSVANQRTRGCSALNTVASQIRLIYDDTAFTTAVAITIPALLPSRLPPPLTRTMDHNSERHR